MLQRLSWIETFTKFEAYTTPGLRSASVIDFFIVARNFELRVIPCLKRFMIFKADHVPAHLPLHSILCSVLYNYMG